MSEDRTRAYEVMFLFGQSQTPNLGEAIDHIKAILDRIGAEVIAMSKWDERRLAFEIDKQKRGLYILVYFRAPASAMEEFERLCRLSESILRHLRIRADHLTEDEMKAADGTAELVAEAKMRAEEGDAPAAAAPAPAAAAAPAESEA